MQMNAADADASEISQWEWFKHVVHVKFPI